MEGIRKVKKVFPGKATIEGAGVHLKRAFGYHNQPLFDPFLLLDEFHSSEPRKYKNGFPWHPHRGIETITYILQGEVEHGDSLGNKGIISAGDVQWMTAGSGIIHQEMPRGDENDVLWGFQLWTNLPASHKMMKPRYREIKSAEIPEVTLYNGVKAKVICGGVDNTSGPVMDIVTDPEYLDVTVPSNIDFIRPVHPRYTALAYVLSGEAVFEHVPDNGVWKDYLVGKGKVVLFEKGENIKVSTGAEKVRFLLMTGKPLNEPIAWYGPIVMNTEKELEIAFSEYEKGTFLKHKAKI